MLAFYRLNVYTKFILLESNEWSEGFVGKKTENSTVFP